MLLKSVFLLVLFSAALGLNSCTQADPPKSRAIQSGGSCSEEYSREYEAILNLPAGSPDSQVKCDGFYEKFPGVKCFSVVDGSELRIHTSDFDVKCLKDTSVKTRSPKSNPKVFEPTPIATTPVSLCSRELVDFVITKKSEFLASIKAIENPDTNDDAAFNIALTSKKMCNQFFFNYKFTECPRDNFNYSFYDLKPYCDEFQKILHTLKAKNPKKFSPQEMKSMTTLNLKFTFQDALVPFYSSKLKIKDAYLVDGMLVSFNDISSNQNYCYFESEKLRFAGELKNEIYKVDVTYPNKNRTVFNYTSFNEQWRMICHSRSQLYQQDLLEIVGDKISIFE